MVSALRLSLTTVSAFVLVVAACGGSSDKGGSASQSRSVATTTPTYRCDASGGDTPTCPEEGPPLTPQQKAQFAQWRSEYEAADVERVLKSLAGGSTPNEDVYIVEILEGDRGCAALRSAWAAAKTATSDRRAAIVETIMRGDLARLKERNWPPQSQMANIFQRLTDHLKSGDLVTFDDGPHSLFEGECGARGLREPKRNRPAGSASSPT